jgi:hypothetical protein
VAHGKRQVTYYHLMFDCHQIIWSEGVPSESFYPGPLALGGLSTTARLSIDAAFSCRDAPIGQSYGPRARAFLTAQECKAFAANEKRRMLPQPSVRPLCPRMSTELAS